MNHGHGKKKGRIQVGADADLVVFDPNRVIDRATFQEPTLSSEGIVHVLVNGVAVVKDEILLEEVYPGQPVRAPQVNANASSLRPRHIAGLGISGQCASP